MSEKSEASHGVPDGTQSAPHTGKFCNAGKIFAPNVVAIKICHHKKGQQMINKIYDFYFFLCFW